MQRSEAGKIKKTGENALDAMNKINERKKYEKSNLTLKNDG